MTIRVNVAALKYDFDRIQARSGGWRGYRRADAARLESIAAALLLHADQVAAGPPPPGGSNWVELARQLDTTRKAYEGLAEGAWQRYQPTEALRYRGIAEGLEQAMGLLGRAVPYPVWRVTQTDPPSMAVDVHTVDGIDTLKLDPAHSTRARIDRVTAETADGGLVRARVRRGADVPTDGIGPCPPGLFAGQVHLGLILVNPGVTTVTNRNISSLEAWDE